MHLRNSLLFIPLLILISLGCKEQPPVEVMLWHKAELTFQGPETSEDAETNPFTDYRLNVRFTNGTKTYVVPGFYAADGKAAESSGTAGNTWKVRFRPDELGTWTYEVSFVKGENIAISDEAGESVAFDGSTGSINVIESDKTGKDFRAHGRLDYTGGRYLQFQGSGQYFLKAGADSPENFLAYHEFDDTYSNHPQGKDFVHEYQVHQADWNAGDPTWQGEKGKAIIGALNYLASTGVNSVYMLTMNIEGDGYDIWPYVDDKDFTRFDCSKLDQWEIVFDHMDKLGLMQHFVTQETENEMLLDDGETGLQRKLYYRELVARFGHHPAITWNMGEENGHLGEINQDTRHEIDMINYIKEVDPFDSFTVLHTSSRQQERDEIMGPLLGLQTLDGPSIQIHHPESAHKETIAWLQMSADAGKQWVVNIDEIGPASRGIDEDSVAINNQDTVRWVTLWGNLMAGGAGVEWYCGYRSANNDLNLESWKTRDRVWRFTSAATDFFQKHTSFTEMVSTDQLINDQHAYCFSKSNDTYVVYDWRVEDLTLDLSGASGTYNVSWFDPITGGDLKKSDIKMIEGDKIQALGNPPGNPDQDWVILIKKQ